MQRAVYVGGPFDGGEFAVADDVRTIDVPMLEDLEPMSGSPFLPERHLRMVTATYSRRDGAGAEPVPFVYQPPRPAARCRGEEVE